MGGSHGGGGGGGLVGGVAGSATSTLGGVAGTAGNVTGGVTSSVGSTVNGAAGGLTAQGTLTNASRGVIGMQELSLSSVTGATTEASVISPTSRTVKLDSGTQMLLQLSGSVR